MLVWKKKLVQPLWKAAGRFLRTLGMEPPPKAASPLPAIYTGAYDCLKQARGENSEAKVWEGGERDKPVKSPTGQGHTCVLATQAWVALRYRNRGSVLGLEIGKVHAMEGPEVGAS